MRLTIFFLVFSIGTPAAVLAQAGGPSASHPAAHPIVGKWTWTRKENNCTEVYEFRPDGTLKVQSGAEKTDNTYQIAKDRDSRGFYKITMKVIKDYGGKDCGDDEADSTGDEYTGYIFLDPSLSSYVACDSPSLDACFGPLRRVNP